MPWKKKNKKKPNLVRTPNPCLMVIESNKTETLAVAGNSPGCRRLTYSRKVARLKGERQTFWCLGLVKLLLVLLALVAEV